MPEVRRPETALRRQVTAALDEAVAELPGEGPLDEFSKALRRLRDDFPAPLRVALAGRSGSGKSTLANALLGTHLLPSGRFRTRTVIWLSYAAEPALTVHGVSGWTMTADPAELEQLTADGPSAGRRPPDTAYVRFEVKNPLLTSFDLIDTPGADDPGTAGFLAQVGADALVVVLRRSGAEEDQELLRTFRLAGAIADLASPLNSVGVLAADSVDPADGPAGEDADAMTAARQVARQLMVDAWGSRLLHDIRPVALQSALAARTFSAQDVRDLSLLVSRVPAEVLAERAENGQEFSAREYTDMQDVDPRRRSELHALFGSYGLGRAFGALGHLEQRDEHTLRERLLDDTGLVGFIDLLDDQFARRADLIKLDRLTGRVERLARDLRRPQAGLTGWDYALLERTVRRFRSQAADAWDRFSVISDCHTPGRLALGDGDVANALRILGEHGRLLPDRLGLPGTASAVEFATRASARKDHWARLDGLPFNGPTKRSCRIVLRACDELLAESIRM